MNHINDISKLLNIPLDKTIKVKMDNGVEAHAQLRQDGLYLLEVASGLWHLNIPWTYMLIVGEAEVVE